MKRYFVLSFATFGTIAAMMLATIGACVGEDPDPVAPKDDATSPSGDATTTPQDGGGGTDASGTDGNTPAGKRSVACGKTACTGTAICCRASDPDAASCVEPGACPAQYASTLECDDPSDCETGQRCCGQTYTEDGGPSTELLIRSFCQPVDPDAGCAALELCNTSKDCINNDPCITTQPNYHPTMNVCQ
jgi:hypothetical protein